MIRKKRKDIKLWRHEYESVWRPGDVKYERVLWPPTAGHLYFRGDNPTFRGGSPRSLSIYSGGELSKYPSQGVGGYISRPAGRLSPCNSHFNNLDISTFRGRLEYILGASFSPPPPHPSRLHSTPASYTCSDLIFMYSGFNQKGNEAREDTEARQIHRNSIQYYISANY